MASNLRAVAALLFCGAISCACGAQSIVNPGGSVLIPGSGAVAQLPSGARAVYLFNDGSGTTLTDSSGNGNNCTLGPTTHAPTWSSFGLTFLGASNQYVTCPAAAFNGAQTIEIWFNNRTLQTVGSTGAIISTDASNGTGLQLLTAGSGWGSTFEMYTSGNFKFLAGEDRVNGPSALGITLGTNPLMYVDGHAVFGYKQQICCVYNSFVATTSAYIGSYKTIGPSFTGDIYAVITRATIASPATIAADNAYIASTRLAPNGLVETDHTNFTAPLWVADGDSIVEGGGVGNQFNVGYIYYASQLIGNPFDTYNVAVGGEGMNQMQGSYNTRVHPLLMNHSNATRIVTIAGGTNDIVSGTVTLATLQGQFTSYCASVHADGGKCIFEDVLPRSAFTTAEATEAQQLNTWAISQWTSNAGIFDLVIDRAGSPIMGTQTVAAGSFNAAYYQDGTHPTALGNQILGQLTALGVDAVSNPGTPFWVKVPLISLVTNAAATTQTVPLLQLGPKQKVCGVTQRVNTAFVGTSITALTSSVGNSLGTATTYGAALSDLATGFQDNGSPATVPADNGIVQATFTATGANLSVLTAGAMDFDICVVSQP